MTWGRTITCVCPSPSPPFRAWEGLSKNGLDLKPLGFSLDLKRLDTRVSTSIIPEKKKSHFKNAAEVTLKDQRFYFFKEKSVYRFLKKKRKLILIPLANLAVMGNNLDCSNINHKFKFTLWNLLWEIPLPSCSSSPKKQIPTSLSGFTLMPFLISLPIHALKDLKPLCEFTVAPWSQDCGDQELPTHPAQHSVALIPPYLCTCCPVP